MTQSSISWNLAEKLFYLRWISKASLGSSQYIQPTVTCWECSGKTGCLLIPVCLLDCGLPQNRLIYWLTYLHGYCNNKESLHCSFTEITSFSYILHLQTPVWASEYCQASMSHIRWSSSTRESGRPSNSTADLRHSAGHSANRSKTPTWKIFTSIVNNHRMGRQEKCNKQRDFIISGPTIKCLQGDKIWQNICSQNIQCSKQSKGTWFLYKA